jgi:hypothetical protein
MILIAKQVFNDMKNKNIGVDFEKNSLYFSF